MPDTTPEPHAPEPFSVKLLKIFVFGIAPALFIIGAIVIAIGFSQRTKQAEEPAIDAPVVPMAGQVTHVQPTPTPTPAIQTTNNGFQTNVQLPKGSGLKEAFVNEGNLVLHIRDSRTHRFQIISTKTGEMVGEIVLNR